MRRFNSKGMWHFPNIIRKKKSKARPFYEKLIIKECYCPNGHNLVSPKVDFKGYNGILMKVTKEFLESEIRDLEAEVERAQVFITKAQGAIEAYKMLLNRLNLPEPDTAAQSST